MPKPKKTNCSNAKPQPEVPAPGAAPIKPNKLISKAAPMVISKNFLEVSGCCAAFTTPKYAAENNTTTGRIIKASIDAPMLLVLVFQLIYFT
jgi:hypothetical protein